MANTKISALTSATTPLAGTEVLPIVQSSATTKVAVSDLTAGRSVSGANFVVTSSTIPANGVYLPAANSVGIATNSTLRATVDSNGNLLVGTATTLLSTTRRLQVEGAVSAVLKGTTLGSEAVNVWQNATSGNNVFIEFDTETTATTRGTISYNRAGGLTVYNTTSDYRAKTVTGPVQNALSKVALLKPSTGRMNGAEIDIDFFVAHELQEVVPSAVTGEKDAIKEDGTPSYQMVDKSAIIPLLAAAIQELKSEFDAYKASHP